MQWIFLLNPFEQQPQAWSLLLNRTGPGGNADSATSHSRSGQKSLENDRTGVFSWGWTSQQPAFNSRLVVLGATKSIPFRWFPDCFLNLQHSNSKNHQSMQEHQTHLCRSLCFGPGCALPAWWWRGTGLPQSSLQQGLSEKWFLSYQQFKWQADGHSHGPYIISSKGGGRSC